MKQARFYAPLCVLFFLICLFTSAQQNYSYTLKTATLSSMDKKHLQQGTITDTWYNDAIANLKQLEYDFLPLDKKGNYKVTNIRNHISCVTSYNGYSVKNILPASGEKAWKVDFTINGIGRNRSVAALSKKYAIEKNIGFVSYKFKNATIDYINNEQGLRQNYTVNKKPEGNGLLKISMRINTTLSAGLKDDKLSFFDGNYPAKAKLIYTDLKVWDANNKTLAAHMEYDKTYSELNLLIDDSNAAFPVTIDPINQTPEWTTSADGLLSGLISNTEITTALYGFTVTSLGDVNGDGFSDAAVSAPGIADIFSGSGTLAAVGAVFVYYGSASGLPTTPNNTLQPNTAVAGALFGFSVDAGDVTGDGKNDIIVGAPLDKYTVHVQTALLGGPPLGTGPLYADISVTAGKVYIFRSEDLPSAPNPSSFLQVKLSDSFFSPGVLGLLGSNITVKSLFGFSVAATDDLNGDGKADIVVGSPSYLGINLLDIQNGSAFVYYSNNLNTTSPVQLQVPPLSLLGLVTLPVINSSGLLFGYSVDGAGDYNSDGHPDIIVGAPAGVDLSSLGGLFTGQVLGGSAYVYYGNGTGVTPTIGARLQASASGLLGNAANLFGYKVKGMKNVNGMRNGNILAGAPTGGLIPNALSLTIQTGNIHLFLKKSGSPSGVIASDQVIESPRSTSLLNLLSTLHLNVLFGASFDNAYDVNCDSYPDLVVGEPLSSGVNISQLQVNATGGSAYIFYGTASGLYNTTPIYTVSATYGGDFLSVNATALLGFSVAGLPKVKGPGSTPRIITGSPSGALDFSSGLLNLGSTLNVLFSFAVGDNGPGKAYSFDPNLCGSFHTLPAEPLNFKGQKGETTVNLNWVATDEKNISQYVLEKSSEGTYFSTMAYVFSKGNDTRNTYSMIDYHPAPVNYYRLRIIHKDNSYIYSSLVKVKFEDRATGEITIAPNPATSDYKLKLTGLAKGIYTIEVKNSAGQLQQKKSFTINEYEHSEGMTRGNEMMTGIYYLNVYDQSNKQVKAIKFLFK